MAGNNPISFSDLFNFNDKQDVVDAINLVRDLKKSYKEFLSDVTGASMSQFESQQKAIATEISKVAKASEDLNITNERSQKVLIENLKVIEKLREENERLRKAKENNRKTEDDLAGSVNGLTKSLNDQIAAWRKIDQSTDEGKAKAAGYAGEIRSLKAQIAALNSETKSTTAVFNAAKGSYAALDAETKKLIQDLKNLEGGISGNNKQAEALKKQIYENTATLKNFDAQMNQNFRNVGNYKSAFNGLGMSINQISRELPAFTNSVQTGFMAISNNLPIFVDEVSRLRQQNAALVAEGKPAQSVMGQIGKSLFSWQTALSVGITLLTVYGAQIYKWAKGFFDAKSAIDKTAESARILGKAFESTDYTNAVKNVSMLRAEINLAKEGLLNKAKVVDHYNETLGGAIGKVSSLEQAEDMLNKKAEAYIKMTLMKAAANMALEEAAKKAMEIERERAEGVSRAGTSKVSVQDQLDARFDPAVMAAQKALDEQGKNASPEQLAKLIKALNDAYTDAVKKDILDPLKKEQKTFEDIANGFMKTAAEWSSKFKIDFFDDKDEKNLDDLTKKQEEIIKASAKLQIANAELNFARSAKSTKDELSLEEQRLAILKESFSLRKKLYKEGSKEAIEIAAEQAEAEKDYAEKVIKIKEKGIEKAVDLQMGELKAIYDKSNKGYLAEIEFELKKLAILSDGYDQRLALYKKDSDEYKQALLDKEQAEIAAQARIKAIKELQDKGRQNVDKATRDLADTVTLTDFRKNSVGKGEAGKREYEQQAHLLKVQRMKEELDAKVSQLQKMKEGDKDYFDTVVEITNMRKALVTEEADWEISEAERAAEKKKELNQAILDFATEAAGQLFDLGRDLNAANIQDLEQAKKRELELAGNNSIARARIEEEYAKKVLALKRKQAIFDKVQALFDIGINTAVAVSKAVAASPTTFGMPFSAFAIAQGALQAAVVLARPLPRYFKGRKGGKAEWAELNEEGTELIEKNGTFRIAAGGKRGIDFLQEGETVHTADQSKKIIEDMVEKNDRNQFIDSLLKGTGVVRKVEGDKEERMIKAMVKSQISKEMLESAFSSALDSAPFTNFEFNEKGIRVFAQSVGKKIELMNSRNSFGGNG